MGTVCRYFFILVVIPKLAFAGANIYGTISRVETNNEKIKSQSEINTGRPRLFPARGLTVILQAGRPKVSRGAIVVTKSETTTTDNLGFYWFRSKTPGKYTLYVHLDSLKKNPPCTIEVYSYKQPTQYNFIIDYKDNTDNKSPNKHIPYLRRYGGDISK